MPNEQSAPMSKEEAIHILKDVLQKIEDHPLFAGYDESEEALNEEGGDIAFITLDVAMPLKAVLKYHSFNLALPLIRITRVQISTSPAILQSKC